MKNERIYEKLKTSIFNNLFKQMDLIIINWGDPIQYSLHVASAIRICCGNQIILNPSDEFMTKEGLPKEEAVYERLEAEGFINDPNSLLAENIAKVNKLLKGKTVKKVEVSKWQDLTLILSNDIVIQIAFFVNFPLSLPFRLPNYKYVGIICLSLFDGDCGGLARF